MEGHYVYRSLENAENIRILILEPAENLKDPLICTLEEVSPENTSYTALSYSWAMEDDYLIEDQKGRNVYDYWYTITYAPGDSSPIAPLILDGGDVLVGQNLNDALRRLRPKSGEPARLWVDALCINQRDDREKGSQVAMMASIYDNANLVVAWLGEGEEQLNAAVEIPFRCLLADPGGDPESHSRLLFRHGWVWELGRPEPGREICPVCRDMGITNVALPHRSSFEAVRRAYGRWKEAPAYWRDGSLLKNMYRAWQCWPDPKTGRPSVPLHEAILTLSRRRYFQRLWVLQEVAIRAADRVAFQWGGFRLAGNPLRIFSGILIFRDFIWQVHMDPFIVQNLSSDNSARFDLFTWMEYSSKKQCSDPRDRVYGLLGCTPAPSGLRADYDKDLTTVYADFARYLLTERKIHLLLHNSCGSKLGSEDGFPTWLPDLRQGFWGLSKSEGEPGEEIWAYASPSISEDNMELRCHLAYMGTIGGLRTGPHASKPGCDVVWRVQREPRHGAYLLDRTEHAQGDAVIASLWEVYRPEGPIEYRPGDVVCGSPDPPVAHLDSKVLLLRSTQTGQWRIVGDWAWRGFQYTGSSRPQERREYCIV